MNVELQRTPAKAEQAAPADLVTLPLECLVHVAGGLPYNGLRIPVDPGTSSLEGPSTELPYNGL